MADNADLREVWLAYAEVASELRMRYRAFLASASLVLVLGCIGGVVTASSDDTEAFVGTAPMEFDDVDAWSNNAGWNSGSPDYWNWFGITTDEHNDIVAM